MCVLVLYLPETLTALKNGKAATQQQQQQQLAQLSDIVGIQDAIWSVLQNKASGDGTALLTSRELIREVGGIQGQQQQQQGKQQQQR